MQQRQRGRSAARPPAPRAVATEELIVERMAPGGAGVAKDSSGRVVFVGGAAPGDRAEVAIDASSRPARGRIVRLVQASPERVEPICPIVGTCGGCDWMHFTPAAQASEHAAIVREICGHAIGSGDAPAAPQLPTIRSHGAGEPFFYRTRARFFVRTDRHGVHAGYRAASSHDLVDVARCFVISDELAAVLAELPAVFAGARGEGDVLAARGAGRKPVVDVAWRGELGAATWAGLDSRVASGAWAGARVTLEGTAKPATFGDPRPHLLVDDLPFVVGAGGFAQPSDTGAAKLAARVAELARSAKPPRSIVELFAGSGTLTIALARETASLTAVEIDPGAVRALRDNLAVRGLAAKVTEGDADTFAIPRSTDLVVLDPPRTGAAGAVRAIVAARPRAVVYVACDPPSLARDLRALTAAGFVVTDLETFELFPQTSHVETVVRLERPRA